VTVSWLYISSLDSSTDDFMYARTTLGFPGISTGEGAVVLEGTGLSGSDGPVDGTGEISDEVSGVCELSSVLTTLAEQEKSKTTVKNNKKIILILRLAIIRHRLFRFHYNILAANRFYQRRILNKTRTTQEIIFIHHPPNPV
jgi:hypothetical protein